MQFDWDKVLDGAELGAWTVPLWALGAAVVLAVLFAIKLAGKLLRIVLSIAILAVGVWVAAPALTGGSSTERIDQVTDLVDDVTGHLPSR
jgi:hypothetical protein